MPVFLSVSLSAMAKALGGYRPLNGHRYPRPDQPRLKHLRVSELCWRTAPPNTHAPKRDSAHQTLVQKPTQISHYPCHISLWGERRCYNSTSKSLTSSSQTITLRALVERGTSDSLMSVDTHFIPFFFFVLENDGST